MSMEIFTMIKLKAFFKGMGSVFAFQSLKNQQKIQKILNQTDLDALKKDWKNVGDDMNKFIK